MTRKCDMKELLWISLFWFVLSLVSRPATANGNYSISCNGTDAVISIDKTFLATFLYTVGDSFYLINQSDPQKVPACKLTDDGQAFTILISDSNFDTCFGEVSIIADNIVTSFVVQYFPIAAPGLSVIFDLCYQWTFRCQVEESYNISSNAILVVAPNFDFNTTMPTQTLGVDFRFYTDITFMTLLGETASSIQVGESIFAALDLAASPNFELSVDNCSIINPLGASILIVESGCPTENINGVNVTRIDSQRIGIDFPVDFFFAEMGEIIRASEQFFIIECASSICDSTFLTCPNDEVCVVNGRKRRSVPMEEPGMMMQNTWTTLHVTAKCDLNCEHGCVYKAKMGFFCTCLEGYSIQADGLSCSEDVLSRNNPILNDPVPDESVPKKNVPKENDEIVPDQLAVSPRTTTTTTTPVTPKKEIIYNSEEQKDVINPEQTDQQVLPESREVVKESSILFYGSIVVLVLLCVLILMMVIQKCRKKRSGKHYAIMNEEGS